MIQKSLFSADQIQDLREEFVNFKLSDMTSEDLWQFAKDVMLKDVNVLMTIGSVLIDPNKK